MGLWMHDLILMPLISGLFVHPFPRFCALCFFSSTLPASVLLALVGHCPASTAHDCLHTPRNTSPYPAPSPARVPKSAPCAPPPHNPPALQHVCLRPRITFAQSTAPLPNSDNTCTYPTSNSCGQKSAPPEPDPLYIPCNLLAWSQEGDKERGWCWLRAHGCASVPFWLRSLPTLLISNVTQT